MFTSVSDTEDLNGIDWFERSSYWNELFSKQKAPKPNKHGTNRRPLILTGHGVGLRVDHGALIVRDGFTRYPQEVKDRHIFPGAPDLPSRILIVDGSGGLTFDVMDWLSEQNIPLIRVDWQGKVVAILGGNGYAANPFRVQWQRETRDDPKLRIAFCNRLITAKIDACINTLEQTLRRSTGWQAAITRAYADKARIESDPPANVSALRVIEANSAAAYFRAWRDIPIQWKGISKRPVPDMWLKIGSRTSPFSIAGNRNAGHPVNAILNYAYAVLQGQLQIQTASEGYDPTAGIMHESTPGASAFIFDVMEAYRPLIDEQVLLFIKSTTFTPSDFVLRSDGVCRLNPELSREIVRVASAPRVDRLL